MSEDEGSIPLKAASIAKPALQRSPVQIKPDEIVSRKKVIKVTIKENSQEKTILSSICEGHSLEEILHHADFFWQQANASNIAGGQQFYDMFTRTVMDNPAAEWLRIRNYNANEKGFTPTLQTFRSDLVEWVSKQSSVQNKGRILRYVRSGNFKKPRDMAVRVYYMRVQQLQRYLKLMDHNGIEESFSDEELKRIFYEGFPQLWKTNFQNAHTDYIGKSNHDILAYMEEQESQATDKELSQQEKKRKTKRKVINLDDDSDEDPSPGKAKKAKFKGKGNGGGKDQKHKQCRKHPQHPHSWHNCFQNPNGPNYKGNKKASKTGNGHERKNGNGKKDVSLRSFANMLPSGIDMTLSKKTSSKQAQENDTTRANAIVTDPDLIRELEEEMARTGKTNTPCPMHCYNATHTFTHHLDAILSQASKAQMKTIVKANETAQPYCYTTTSFMNDALNEEKGIGLQVTDAYETINIKNNISKQLHEILRPMTLLAVDKIQNTDNKKLLHALVDPGSDRTFIWNKVLPKRVTPAKLKQSQKVRVMGSTTSINSVVVLDDMMLPELSRTMKIKGPFTAFVFVLHRRRTT